MRRITKTVFVHSYRCPKLCWLERHKREAVNDDGSLHSAEGNEVGDLAMKYFGDYIEIPYGKPEDMAAQTAQVLHDSRARPSARQASWSATCFARQISSDGERMAHMMCTR